MGCGRRGGDWRWVGRGGWVVWGGERTGLVGEAAGVGGRNQEGAVAGAGGLGGVDGVAVVSVGTDGVDGPTDAAGAVVDGGSWAAMLRAGNDPVRALAEHDRHRALHAVGGLIRTGPPGANVCDVVAAVAGGVGRGGQTEPSDRPCPGLRSLLGSIPDRSRRMLSGSRTIQRLLANMAKIDASDLHVKVGIPPTYRVGSRLRAVDADPLSEEEADHLLDPILTEHQRKQFGKDGNLDFAWHLPDGDRFRVNMFRSGSHVHAAIRRVKAAVPTYESLHLPPIYDQLVERKIGRASCRERV